MQDFAMVVGEPTISSVLIGEHPDELLFQGRRQTYRHNIKDIQDWRDVQTQ